MLDPDHYFLPKASRGAVDTIYAPLNGRARVVVERLSGGCLLYRLDQRPLRRAAAHKGSTEEGKCGRAGADEGDDRGGGF